MTKFHFFKGKKKSKINLTYVAVVCYSTLDFNNYLSEKGLNSRLDVVNQIMYRKVSMLTDVVSYRFDRIVTTEQSLINPEYNDIIRYLQSAMRHY